METQIQQRGGDLKTRKKLNKNDAQSHKMNEKKQHPNRQFMWEPSFQIDFEHDRWLNGRMDGIRSFDLVLFAVHCLTRNVASISG